MQKQKKSERWQRLSEAAEWCWGWLFLLLSECLHFWLEFIVLCLTINFLHVRFMYPDLIVNGMNLYTNCALSALASWNQTHNPQSHERRAAWCSLSDDGALTVESCRPQVILADCFFQIAHLLHVARKPGPHSEEDTWQSSSS